MHASLKLLKLNVIYIYICLIAPMADLKMLSLSLGSDAIIMMG